MWDWFFGRRRIRELSTELTETQARLRMLQDRNLRLESERDALIEERDHLRDRAYEDQRRITDFFAVSSSGRAVFDVTRDVPLPTYEPKPLAMRSRRDRPSISLEDLLPASVREESDAFDAALESLANGQPNQ